MVDVFVLCEAFDINLEIRDVVFYPPPFQLSQFWVQIVGVMLFWSMLEINDVVVVVSCT